MKSRFLSVSGICLLAAFAAVTPVRAAQMSVTSFPDEVIISATDNRTIAFIAAEDGERVQGATIKVSLAGIGGKFDASSCQTDESGQCHLNYTAPQELGEGEIEAVVSMAGAETGSASIDLEVVPIPNTKDSGWQCDKDNAVFPEIDQEISCESTCSRAKDCTDSPCQTGSGNYCYSAVEACACTGTDSETQGKVKGATTTSTASDGECDPSKWHYCNPLRGTVESLSEAGIKSIQALLGLIGTIALLLLVIAGVVYITAAGNEEKIKQAKKIITGTIIGLGIALVAYSLLVTVSEILEVKD